MNFKNITTPVFLVFAAVILFLTYTSKLPKDLMGCFGLIFVLGILYGELGDRLPVVKDWLGGGPIVCIFGPALMVYFGLIPQYTVTMISDFMDKMNFFAMFISFLVGGSILAISRKIVLGATVRFLPAMIGGIIGSLGAAWLVGAITGYGGMKSLMYLGIPIMGGGVGAGAMPLSVMYAASGKITAKEVLSIVMPAVVLSNVIAIFYGAILDRLGKKYPVLTGNGEIMRIKDPVLIEEMEREKHSRNEAPITIDSLGIGFFICISVYLAGVLIQKFLVPSIHTFVWMILLFTIIKAVDLLNPKIQLGTIQWSQVWVKNLINAALIPIGLGYTDIGLVLTALGDPVYVLLVVTVVAAAGIGAGIVGHFVGLYFVETALAAGICAANMGQTGDLAVLSAAKRMEILPWTAYATRVGGSIVLVLAGLLMAKL
ncbi:MAG TPA: 2-hydroxycarboxylate transporter family protein [Selenomonadales bacterium]|nr:2-hydroxycarboxylate transporter family protein [Selenomonadales bacterium]